MSFLKIPGRRWLWPSLALAAILLANLFLSPNFFSIRIVDGHLFGSLIDILHRGTPLAFVALGMAVVIATGGIDLSVGAIIAICGATMAVLLKTSGLPPVLVLLAVVAVGILCGLWNGLLVAFLDIQPIVATLILMVAGRGIAQMITDGQIVTFHSDFFQVIGGGFFLGLPVRVLVVLGFAILLALVLRRTAMGLFLEAVGGNAAASRLAGIEARWIRLSAYAISGLCSALAGIVLTADIKGADANNAGLWLELDAILAVVIGGAALKGGRFALGLTLIGVLVIQSLTTTILVSGLPSQYTLVVKACVVLAVLFLQSPRLQRLRAQ
ncbi:ABC transporter permease [Lacibacterium aquatile]|uniref:ABC transporter permease n=1 Tax=Lacibacterium aquatile TaxID=1168082 RepID=A0ABW5DTV2_9PROT